MRNKILFLILITFLLISCGKKEKEPKKEPAPVKAEKVAGEVPQDEKEELSGEVEGNSNPLSEYVSDEVYEDGIRRFYGEDSGMFLNDADKFTGGYEELKAYVESNFKITMLATQGGKSSAVLYYPSEEGEKRVIVTGGTILEIGEKIFYVKAFKDRVEIKQGKKGRAVPLYLRER